MIRKYAEIFCWKNVSSFCTSFCSAKATHILSAKTIRILYIESTKIVNEMTLNELVKLTMLWTTGPSLLLVDVHKDCWMSDIVDPDQMLHSAMSDVGLHYLFWPVCPNTWVNTVYWKEQMITHGKVKWFDECRLIATVEEISQHMRKSSLASAFDICRHVVGTLRKLQAKKKCL